MQQLFVERDFLRQWVSSDRSPAYPLARIARNCAGQSTLPSPTGTATGVPAPARASLTWTCTTWAAKARSRRGQIDRFDPGHVQDVAGIPNADAGRRMVQLGKQQLQLRRRFPPGTKPRSRVPIRTPAEVASSQSGSKCSATRVAPSGVERLRPPQKRKHAEQSAIEPVRDFQAALRKISRCWTIAAASVPFAFEHRRRAAVDLPAFAGGNPADLRHVFVRQILEGPPAAAAQLDAAQAEFAPEGGDRPQILGNFVRDDGARRSFIIK